MGTDRVIKPYDGDEAYVFVSYSHKDSEEVLEIIENMQQAGYRVWYDNGICPGDKWTRKIVYKIKYCTVFLAFWSESYLDSEVCLNELEYARNHVANRTLIYLKNIKLPDEIEFNHCRIQNISKYKLTEEEFYSKLYSTLGIDTCNSGEISSGDSPVWTRNQPSLKAFVDNHSDGVTGTSNNYHYSYEGIGCYGRSAEYAMLEKFLNSSEKEQWSAIVADSGTGKSKLVYSYSRLEEYHKGWKILLLKGSEIEEAEQCYDCDYSSDLLIVFDYVQGFADRIGSWFFKLSKKKHSHKFRMLLLERRGEIKGEFKNTNWTWLEAYEGNGDQASFIERACYKLDGKNSIYTLSSPEQNAGKEIVFHCLKDRIAQHDGKGSIVLNDELVEKIYSQAAKIDHRFESPRPLILIFTANAYLEDDQKWNLEELVRYIRNHLIAYWRNSRILPEIDKDTELLDSLESLLLYATATGSFLLEDGITLPSTFEEKRKHILEKTDKDERRKILSAINMNEKEDGMLNPLEPDLIGESYVLEAFLQAGQDGTLPVMARELLCSRPEGFRAFLGRCMADYLGSERYKPIFAGSFKNFEIELETLNHEQLDEWIYCAYLMTYWGSLDNIIEVVEWFEQVLESYEGEDKSLIALRYARGLVNLSCEQNLEGRTASVEKLRKLTERYAGNEKIAQGYAKGLVNLSNKQDFEGRKTSVEKLRKLTECYVGNEKIALRYTRGLVNLSLKQDLEGRTASVERLRELTERYAGNEEIAVRYAKCLVNLSLKQDLEGITASVERLIELTERYAGNEEIAIQYAKGLFNLSCEQDLEGRTASVEKLKELAGRYAGNEEIAIQYAMGLFNLSNKQDLEGRTASVEKLKELAGRYAGNEEIAVRYAKGLVNLSSKQDLEGRATSVERLRELTERYTGNEEIAVPYARGLFNLSLKQDLEGITASVERLIELTERYAGNEEIAVRYAKGLVNLSNKQDLEGITASVERLRELTERYTGNEEISECLSDLKAIFNLQI